METWGLTVACSGDTYALFSALYLPSMGGVEKYTDNLAHELAREGHRVVIVTSAMEGEPSYEMIDEAIEVMRLPAWQLLGGRLPMPRRNREYRRLVGELARRDWAGVLVNTRFYAHSLLGSKIARRCGVRPVVLDHGSAYLTLGGPFVDVFVRGWEHAATLLIRRCPADYYGVSRRSADWLRTFGIDAAGVLPNAIDASAYRASASARRFRSELGIPEGHLLVSFTGRLIPEKGVDVLVDAMDLLGGCPVTLVVAGDGPLRSRLSGVASDQVKWVGRLVQSDIAALLLESDLFCLPTRSEGFSTSLLEASACGVPSLITEVGGTDELVPTPQYGNVIHGDVTAESLAAAIRELVRDRPLLAAQGERVRERVEQTCSWEATAHAFVEACARANGAAL